MEAQKTKDNQSCYEHNMRIKLNGEHNLILNLNLYHEAMIIKVYISTETDTQANGMEQKTQTQLGHITTAT